MSNESRSPLATMMIGDDPYARYRARAEAEQKAAELSKLRHKLLVTANDCELTRSTTDNKVVAAVLKEAQRALLEAYTALLR